MKCKYEHDGDCCNSGATQYMCRCKQPCYTIVPMTNADAIRALSDDELANFIADKSVNESTLLRLNENHGLSAVQIEAIKHNVYCAFRQWLVQPAE